jgi:predicted transcriptional regulator
MTDTRSRIADCVRARPGVHFNDLVRRLDLAPGQVQHHLKRLLSDERLVADELYGRTHYYPPEFDAWERRVLALVRRETPRDVVACLLDEGGSAPPARVADAVGIARSTLEWHLDNLVETDVVTKSYDERGRVTLTLRHPERTAELVASVSPSLPERFADRFTRLVDDLLAEE